MIVRAEDVAGRLEKLSPVVRAQIEHSLKREGEAWVAQSFDRLVAEAKWAAHAFDDRALPGPLRRSGE